MHHEHTFTVGDYDLAATLSSGQAFRWETRDGDWEGVVNSRWVRLRQEPNRIRARVAAPVAGWNWLSDYLQVEVDLDAIIKTFPDDEPMRRAVAACRGLRLLKQDPWECLASFILSSTKQIVQIRQIVALLCRRFGEPIPAPAYHDTVYSFPAPERIAAAGEAGLRACKMGFRAPYLLGAARVIVERQFDLEALSQMTAGAARSELLRLPGVGRKVADCVLLFAYGFQEAFPVDVWVIKALQQLYFPKRKATLRRLHRFSETHFGSHAGFAQQYLFHYMRTKRHALPEVPV